MSEVLIGVIIGGLIASITPIITLCFNHYQWKKEAKINHLRLKRNKLEVVFKKAEKMLAKAMAENSFSADLAYDFQHLFPKKVIQAWKKMLSQLYKNRNIKDLKHHYFLIIKSMKESLVDIGDEIEKAIG